MDHTGYKLSMLLLMITVSLTHDSAAASTSAAASSSYMSEEEQMILEQSTDVEYNFYLRKMQQVFGSGLEYDYYRDICGEAEEIIQTTMKELFSANPPVAPQLIRLVFHDCIVGGCDASVLLNETDDGTHSERDAVPNGTLKGFDDIEIIKSSLEEACPGAVSCADTLVLAARAAVSLAGGPYYPLFTGRRDSSKSHFSETDQIPFPTDDITTILEKFTSKGFNEKEIVSLLGSHNIGIMGCQFFDQRYRDFHGTGQPDPSINPAFLQEMRSACNVSGSSMLSGIRLDDNHYYKKLLNGSVALFSDQQLMANSMTAELVRNYAFDDGFIFKRDFARAMVKLSSLNVLTGSNGIVRKTCSKLSN